jgi:hypothetical protein
MKADVQAFKPADFYAVYIGFRCAYDLQKSNTFTPAENKSRP